MGVFNCKLSHACIFSLMLQAAVVADQNAKLSIFATRPAIYSPMFNFITEAMGTTALLLLLLLMDLQVSCWIW